MITASDLYAMYAKTHQDNQFNAAKGYQPKSSAYHVSVDSALQNQIIILPESKDMKFKIGDKVRYAPTGDVGEVLNVDRRYRSAYTVRFGTQQGSCAEEDLEAYADSVKVKVTFDSVILPEAKKQQIVDAIRQVDHHKLIFEDWGFGETFEKGTAVSLLFYGPPGTGKTLMAQAIADKYKYDLKVIGTAEIESAMPGQAERNMKRIFGEAQEHGRTVLLFDECDSLIYDRNNVGAILGAQVNCLLGCLENYKGIVIFTTNRLGTLDEAVNRRLSLKLEFDMPSAELRVDIWRRMFPKKAPLADDVDFEAYAEVEITGGYIKNVVLRAARMAANEDTKKKQIRHIHIVKAIQAEVNSMTEFQDAEKPRTPRLRKEDYRQIGAF